ncbi:MAG: hypothetical protein ABI880_02245 [Acidobacteriota bacterium]
MRTITTSRGKAIDVDETVDVLAIIEAVFQDRWEDDDSYEGVQREIAHVVGQLSDAECRSYLVEALFVSYNTYENGRSDRVIKKLDTLDSTEP